MKSSTAEALPSIGAPMTGGFYVGRIRVDGQFFALIVAPKDEGEHKDSAWISRGKDVPGAKSYFDGHANTLAMAAAGSKLAKWAQDLRIGGAEDWYLPAQDELEILYRHLKPTTEKNWCYARSGINLTAGEPTRPYTPDFPVQTPDELFQSGGAEAFDPVWYWSSTQHAGNADSAWAQHFDYGCQSVNHKGNAFRARAVRRVAI